MQMKRYCVISVLMQTTYFRFFLDIAHLLYTLLLFYHVQRVHAFSIVILLCFPGFVVSSTKVGLTGLCVLF
jgi:hypothetical protein